MACWLSTHLSSGADDILSAELMFECWFSILSFGESENKSVLIPFDIGSIQTFVVYYERLLLLISVYVYQVIKQKNKNKIEEIWKQWIEYFYLNYDAKEDGETITMANLVFTGHHMKRYLVPIVTTTGRPASQEQIDCFLMN